MSRRARYTPLGDDVPGVNVGVGLDENEGEREDGRVRVARAGLPSPLTPPLPPAALAADGAAGHPSLRRRTAWGARAGPGTPPGGGGGGGGGAVLGRRAAHLLFLPPAPPPLRAFWPARGCSVSAGERVHLSFPPRDGAR